jgi:hypothetical protein
MRIGFISTEMDEGGAARAMQRTITSLRDLGHEVVIFSLRSKGNTKAQVFEIYEHSSPRLAARNHLSHIFYNGKYVAENRSENSNTLFWIPAVGYDLSGLIKKLQIDVINIHWTSYFINLSSLDGILNTPTATVFTLHDMAHFTGGCHYSGECREYESDCGNCAQLRFDPLRLPSKIRALKADLYRRSEPWAISPSKWLQTQAIESGLFSASRCLHV